MMSSFGAMQLALLILLSFACAEQKHGAIIQSAARVPAMDSEISPGSLGTKEKGSALAPTTKIEEAGDQEGDCNPGEILVRFRDGTDAQTMARIQKEVELKTLRLVSSPDLYLMQVVGKLSAQEAVQRLRKYREVIFAEPNYVRRIQ